MSLSLIITLNDPAHGTGPFDIYSVDGIGNITGPLASGIPIETMISGYTIYGVPNDAVNILVESNNPYCQTSIEIIIPTTTTTSTTTSTTTTTTSTTTTSTTTTTTTTSTTTTTTLAPCLCHSVEITGSVDLSWIDCDNIEQTFTYSNITVNICARQGSVVSTGEGSISISVGSSCTMEEDCWEELIIDADGVDAFGIRQLLIWGAPYTTDPSLIPWLIDYGDGTIISFTGSQTINPGDPADHTYSSPYTGPIKIKAPSLGLIHTIIERISGMSYNVGSAELVGSELYKLTNLSYIQNLNWELNADAVELPDSLDNLYSLNGTITGDTSNLPTTLTQILLLGVETNTLGGNLSAFPTGMTSIRIAGNNTITGNINTFPLSFAAQLVNFRLLGDNTISGDLLQFSSYTALLEFYVVGYNTLSGDICNFNNTIQTIRILGYSSPTGTINCLASKTSLTILQLENNEDDPLLPPGTGTTVAGDIQYLPDSLQTVIIAGYNTLSGNVINMPTNISFWILRGENKVTGDISSIPVACDQFYHGGYHTLFGNIGGIPSGLTRFMIAYKAGGSANLSGIVGDISNLPANIIQFELDGNHSVNIYSTPRVWAPNMNVVEVRPSDRGTYAIPTAELDQLIIDLAATTWTKTSSFDNDLYLVGARSATSDTAIATLSAIPPPNDLTIDINP
jgi:hypothetical protein